VAALEFVPSRHRLGRAVQDDAARLDAQSRAALEAHPELPFQHDRHADAGFGGAAGGPVGLGSAVEAADRDAARQLVLGADPEPIRRQQAQQVLRGKGRAAVRARTGLRGHFVPNPQFPARIR
jgi:hypothetical protein